MAQGPSLADNLVLPFQVERASLRGRFVRLGPLLSEVLDRHDYPEPVARLLAELTVLTALLGSALKYEGVFTLQTSGKGPISILVADMTSQGEIRAYAQFDAARVDAFMEGPERALVPALLGAGHLAFTVDQGPDTERYQGIVALEGTTLTECIHHYFRQSEQLDAAIKVAVEHPSEPSQDRAWQGGAIMVQRLPGEDKAVVLDAAEAEENWREAVTLMGSAKASELMDPALSPDRLLYRLFHEPGVRAFQPYALVANCRCSHSRVARTLAAFPHDEVRSMMEENQVSVRCEFCGADYVFDEKALEALYLAPSSDEALD
jgi:molecular chaperone Hsp33